MNCFKTCLRYGGKMGEAVVSIFQPLMGLTMRISTTVDSQIAHKIPDFQYPLSTDTENGVPCYQKRCLLLMKYSNTFIRCHKPNRYELSYTSFCHSWVSPRYYPPRLTLKMHSKCQLLSTLPVQKIEHHSTMRGIYCL